jgi:iron complex outermembrane receptor protein
VLTAGQRNLASLYYYRSVSYARTRRSAIAQGEYALTPRLIAYGEILFVNRENMAQLEPPALMGALVGSANPHNPFGVDVLVDALLTDIRPRRSTRQAEMLRVAAGVRGRLREWHWEASLQKAQDDATAVPTRELNQARVADSLAASDPGVALDLFRIQGATSPAVLASLLEAPSVSRFRTEAVQSTASASGTLASLPAGRLEVTVGGEWREERAQYDIAAPAELSGSHQRSVVAAFGEVRVPLVSAAAEVPGGQNLSMVLSGRLDDYSDVGRSFNPEYALIWRPTSAVALRASIAQSFRPPSLVDLYLPPVDSVGPLADPARNAELALPIWRAGGNSGLKPSSADSLSVSIQFEPKGPRPLRLGANYWQIAIDDSIAIPFATRLLAAETLFPERVVRGPRSDSDIAAGIPGPLQLIDVSRLNLTAIRSSGVDVNASVTFDTRAGRFKPDLSATWVHDFTTSDLLAGPSVERVGVASVQGTIPRWRATASLSWNYGAFGIRTVMRYLPSYDDVNLLETRNGRQVDEQLIVDAQLSLDLANMTDERSPWNGFEVRVGAFNLFNAEPPFAEGWFEGYDTSQSDLRQRFIYLKLARKF